MNQHLATVRFRLPESFTSPRVSVLLPVRDGSAFLTIAVKSILAQTVSDLELVIIDDGSQDATPTILEGLAAADPRIRVLRQSPLGVAAALNAGLKESRAPFVARMDADDIAAPERLATQLEALTARPDVVALGSACRVIDDDGKLVGYRQPPIQPDQIRRILQSGNCMIHPTMMMRRDPVLRAGGYRVAFRFCEDFDLWIRLSERYDLLNLPENLLDYREHHRQVTWQSLEERTITELAALALARRRRAGRADIVDESTEIDRQFLLGLGVSEQSIASHIVASTLGTAREALNADLASPARDAIRLLLRQPSLSLRIRLRAFALLLRSYLTLQQLRSLLPRQRPT